MSTTPTYNKRDIQKILLKNGWILQRSKGSHNIYKNKNGKHITVRCTKCNKMIMQRLIKENNLIVDQK